MTTSTSTITATFKTWCAAHGLTPTRYVDGAGQARLLRRRGRYSVEIGVAPSDYSARLGLTLGFEYPILERDERTTLRLLGGV